jgi:hypothetical protein
MLAGRTPDEGPAAGAQVRLPRAGPLGPAARPRVVAKSRRRRDRTARVRLGKVATLRQVWMSCIRIICDYATTRQHCRHRDADSSGHSTGLESPTCQTSLLDPRRTRGWDPLTAKERRQARGRWTSRSCRALRLLGRPARRPRGWCKTKVLKRIMGNAGSSAAAAGCLMHGRALGSETRGGGSVGRGGLALARQNRLPSALPAMPGPSSWVAHNPPSDLKQGPPLPC